MSKKKETKVKSQKANNLEDKKTKNNFSINKMDNKMLFVFTGLFTLIYFAASTFSDGFFMHDEPMFYMYAKDLVKNPVESFQGFQKIGYTIFMVLPSFFGFTFVKFISSLLSAITITYAYKVLRKLGSGNSFLVFFLLGLQPLWFMLAFRDFSEYLVAFLLVMTLWNHLQKKYIFAALLLSYAALTRMEYHVLLGLYFVILIVKREWIPALCTGALTILHNFIGFLITEDPLYLYTKVVEYSAHNSGAYPKRGFEHYLVMSNIVFGGVSLTLFVTYLSNKILKKEKPLWLVTGATLFIILFNCLINWQSVEIGPGNAGNLRYFIPITPLVAILGVLAIDDLLKLQKKYILLIFLVPFLIGVAVFQTYDHNFMSLLTEGERLWIPLVVMVIMTGLIVLPLKQSHYLLSIGLLSVLVATTSVRTFNLNPEDKTMEKAGKWYVRYLKKNKGNQNALFNEESRVACSHILFYHFTDKSTNDFVKKPIIDFTKEDTDGMEVGDLIVWESHYGYRPKLRPTSQTYDYYDKDPRFEKIQYYQSKDKRFLIAFFRKVRM